MKAKRNKGLLLVALSISIVSLPVKASELNLPYQDIPKGLCSVEIYKKAAEGSTFKYDYVNTFVSNDNMYCATVDTMLRELKFLTYMRLIVVEDDRLVVPTPFDIET